MNKNTDLIIIGGGAAGLMGAVAAAEAGLRVVVIERKNQPGRKLLMCGNNRCNLTSDLPLPKLLDAYGAHNAQFLEPALQSFTPKDLQAWFNQRGLPTKVLANKRVYPKTERANDVVNKFKDLLRDLNIPIILNCSVTGVHSRDRLFTIETDRVSLTAPNLLVATGGVSYPKTGSVGDGQKFARDLGHKVSPYRPGLAAFDVKPSWWTGAKESAFVETRLTILSEGKTVAETSGGIEIRNGHAHGPAMIDASNLVSRLGLRSYTFIVDLVPALSTEQLTERLSSGNLKKTLSSWIPHDILSRFMDEGLNRETSPAKIAVRLKEIDLPVTAVRPLKEAMVTVGGIMLEDINPHTMESTLHPGLFFAGEVMDVEGPCGGFNLQIAWATAQLAVRSLVPRCTAIKQTSRSTPGKAQSKQMQKRHQNHNRKGKRPFRQR